MREVIPIFSLFVILLWFTGPEQPQQQVETEQPVPVEQTPAVVYVYQEAAAPVGSKAQIVAGNPILSGFYATGDVWCFQSSACQHLGTDLSANYGDPVYAPYAAVVTMVDAYYDPARAGQYVIIELQDGCSLYLGHLQGVTVAAGQLLTAGSLLGYIGPENHEALGWPGPHTHVQLTCGGQLMDWEAYDAQRS